MLYDTRWDEKLPTTYKTAEELKISEKEHTALQQVMQMLESGEIAERDLYQHLVHQTKPKVLHMGSTRCSTACGTAACIGGWVAILTDEENIDEYVWGQNWLNNPRAPLHNLYWQHTRGRTTTAQAAQAIKNFLTTGDPNWASVLERA